MRHLAFFPVMDLHVNEDVQDPRSLIPDLPDEMCNFIKHATRRDPAARYKSISEVINDLELLAKKMGIELQPQLKEQRKMMSLFLFYQDQNELALKRLVEDFSREVNLIGAELRAAEFKDV